MSGLIIPTRLRRYFREAATNISLREIKNYWEDEGFAPGFADSGDTSARRTAWSSYEAAVDWANQDDLLRVIRVYESTLPEPTDPTYLSFVAALQRDGWDVESSGRIVSITGGRGASGVRTVNDRYELDPAPIGRGGFGHVFLATIRSTDWYDGDRVAIKLMLPDKLSDATLVRRFQREITAMKTISHEHVLPILDSGYNPDDGWWYTMPIAEGGSLVSHMQQNPSGLALSEALEIMRMICLGVTAIHDANYLHRDLSPGNILKRGDNWLVSDFGLSVGLDRDTTVLTESVYGAGTPVYYAPEQWGGLRDVTRAADVYSMGKLLQYMTTGQPPYTEPRLTHPLRGIILRATNVEETERHASASDLFKEIEKAIVVPTGFPRTDADIQDDYLSALGSRNLIPSERLALVQWLGHMDELDYGVDIYFLNVLPKLHEADIRSMWREDAKGFALLFGKFCRIALEFQSFNFSDVDAPGRFASRAAKLTGAPEIRRQAIELLAKLGYDKNRWLLRELALELVRGLRPGPMATAVVEGFARAGAGATYWVMQDFNPIGLDSDTRARLRAVMSPVLDARQEDDPPFVF